MLDTLDMFDPSLIQTIARTISRDEKTRGKAKAARRASKIQARRAKSEAELASLLPAVFTPDESWHVISHGDIDSLSYLAHAIAGVTHFDLVTISTWCMARPDLEQLKSWLDAGRIDRLEMYVGEIFPNQYGDEFELLLEMARVYGVRVVVARNHSKVMLARQGDYCLVCESSANVNTNPRIEQTAIHCSQHLLEFYLEFFRELKTIDRRSAWASE